MRRINSVKEIADSKKAYWQSVRGICIHAVVLIHALGGYDYSDGATNTAYLILRQLINFAVATFIFMSGYFVNIGKIESEEYNYKSWLTIRGGRLLIPFVIWSLLYSGVNVLRNIHKGEAINWLGVIYRFIVGKSATPFYYIVVLFQLTLVTPFLVKTVKEKGIISKLLWLVTPIYLVYVYAWNFMTGSSPRLYETLFPAWFGFYYLGIQVKCGMKMNERKWILAVVFLLSCFEALFLRQCGMSQGFCTSQITAGSFLYTVAFIGVLLQEESRWGRKESILSRIGDCSYGIFYIHMIILLLIGKLVSRIPWMDSNWVLYWGMRFVLTSTISFAVVLIGQKYIGKKMLRWIGFV